MSETPNYPAHTNLPTSTDRPTKADGSTGNTEGKGRSSSLAAGDREAAALIGVSASTLRAWRSQGRGPAYARLGRRIVYPRAALERFLAENLVEAQN